MVLAGRAGLRCRYPLRDEGRMTEVATFREVREEDLPAALDIYNHYIVTTTATFHPRPISMETLRSFIFLDHPRYKAYVIEHMGNIAGFCFLTQFKKHESYDRTAELGIYVAPGHTRQGLGTQAVRHLETIAAGTGLRMLMASISGENAASIELFRKLKWEPCGRFRKVGEKWGRAIDVVFFQKSLVESPSLGPGGEARRA